VPLASEVESVPTRTPQKLQLQSAMAAIRAAHQQQAPAQRADGPASSSALPASVSGGGKSPPPPVVPRRASADGDGDGGSRYTLREKLGSGSYGVVFKAIRQGRNNCPDETVVVKKISLGGLSEREQADALNEVKVMASLDHPNVVRYFDSFIGSETHGCREHTRPSSRDIDSLAQ